MCSKKLTGLRLTILLSRVLKDKTWCQEVSHVSGALLLLVEVYFILVMTSTSASQQPSGSSAAAPIYTTTVPLAKPPDPLNLEDRSRRGDNWLHFKRAWQIYERAAGISQKDGPVRVAHFLNIVGREGVQLFDTFTFAEDESADNIDDVLAKFESRCLPQRNQTYERYLFNKREQEPGESVDQYCTALMRLSEHCGFLTLRDSLIRDRLILGVKNDRSRKKLLEKKDLTLDNALDILRTQELTDIRALDMTTEEANVNRVKAKKTKPPKTQTEDTTPHKHTSGKKRTPPWKSREKSSGNPDNVYTRECKFCGTVHEMKKSACPAVGKKCTKCGRDGHFAKKCHSRSVNHVQDCEIYSHKPSPTSAYVTACLNNNAQVQLQIDTGASCNILPKSAYIRATGDKQCTNLEQSFTRLIMHNKTVVWPLGQIRLLTERKGRKYGVLYHIVKQDLTPLLCRTTCEKMNLVKIFDADVNAIHDERIDVSSNVRSDPILYEFTNIFTGIGCLEGTYSIQVDEGFRPVVHPPRKVPVPLRDTLKLELDNMVKSGILAKVVEPTSWVSSLVIVKKSNGKIRVCLDPRDLNRAVKRSHYPLPTIEEVATRLSGAKVFSVLDAKCGFWQVQLDEKSSYLTTMNTPFGRYRTATNIGPIKDSSGVIHADDTSKANTLNSFFVNVGKSLSKSTQDSSVNSPCQSARKNSASLYNIALNRDLLKSSLRCLKPGKASGPDDISSKELYLIGDAFLDCFMPLAQRSILECKLPSQWKQAQVKCLHKKGNTLDCENYRPISLLSIPGKLLENVVSQQLDNFLYSNNLISLNQWGFRKGSSPELLLLSVTERWRLALDESNIIGVVFIDFRKAFDCVNHTVLMDKLHSIGISGSFYDWLLNYLDNRKQFVTVNGSNSELLEIDTGVPQGSLLGPRLYSIYSNDLPGATTNASVEMFADDTTVFCIGNTVDEVLFKIQKAIVDLNKWAKDNFMTIHPAKSELMLLSKSRFIGPLQKICLGQNELSFVSKATCLGILIDNKLSWSPHIKSLSKRFSARVKKLKHLKGLDNRLLESIYFKGIIPSIAYSIALWGSSKSLQTLEDIHIGAARFIFNLKESTPNTEVLAATKWKSLSYFYKKRIATISYQAFYNRAPAAISSLFTKHSPLRNLRDNLKLFVQRPKSDFRRSSFSHHASVLWNNLPVYLKSKPNIVSFKSALKAKSDILDKITFNGLQGLNKDVVNYIY